MSSIKPVLDHLAPDCVARLELAAKRRFDEAEDLVAKKRFLAALYFFGFSVEMCLTAAYFRSAGFSSKTPIDRDSRHRRMKYAKKLRQPTGESLMGDDPHPLVGWARFLQWQRHASASLAEPEVQRLKEAVRQAERVYKHWRPELRYKTVEIQPSQLDEVRRAATWMIQQQSRL